MLLQALLLPLVWQGQKVPLGAYVILAQKVSVGSASASAGVRFHMEPSLGCGREAGLENRGVLRRCVQVPEVLELYRRLRRQTRAIQT